VSLSFIQPDWPAPARVKAYVSQRQGGVSLAPYDSLNMATHVGDDLSTVLANRKRVAEHLSLPSEPFWLNQVHGVHVVSADESCADDVELIEADGAWTYHHNRVLAIMTADCLPILLTDLSGSFVMALHAGWRGLADGVIQQAVRRANLAPEQVMAWVGPGIGFSAFEISADVRERFLSLGQAEKYHFKPSRAGHWLADLAGIALWQLDQLSVCWLGGGHWCTFSRPEAFFSYRRDGVTGRMATLIWLGD
jgi:hypothetical protein